LASSFVNRLPLSVLEELAATRTVEEVKTVLTASQLLIEEMNLPPMRNDEEERDLEEETPNQAYRRLQKEFAHLENVSLTRQDAALKYEVSYGTIADWEKQGLVRVIQKAKRRGLPTWVNEKDVAVMVGMTRKFRTGKSGPIKGWRPPVRNKAEENE
jgi:hypothetical protein